MQEFFRSVAFACLQKLYYDLSTTKVFRSRCIARTSKPGLPALARLLGVGWNREATDDALVDKPGSRTPSNERVQRSLHYTCAALREWLIC